MDSKQAEQVEVRKRIRGCLRERGITVTELASALKVGTRRLNDVINGASESKSLRSKLAEALGESWESLTARPEQPASQVLEQKPVLGASTHQPLLHPRMERLIARQVDECIRKCFDT